MDDYMKDVLRAARLEAKTAKREAARLRVERILRNGSRFSAAPAVFLSAKYLRRRTSGEAPGWWVLWQGAASGEARIGYSRPSDRPSVAVIVRAARRAGLPSGVALGME